MKLDEIINSWENRPEAFTGQKVDEATFIGPNSQAWRSGAYEEALQMEKWGKSPEEIWAKTMTGRSVDNKWRQEISDDKAYLKNPMKFKRTLDNNWMEHGTLFDYLKHDELERSYPGIEASTVTTQPQDENNPSTHGVHYPGGLFGDYKGPTHGASFNADALNMVDRVYGDKEKDFSGNGVYWDRDTVEKYYPTNNVDIPLNKDYYNKGDQRDPKIDAKKWFDNITYPNITMFGGQGADAGGIMDTLLHENQHSIQGLENWGKGTDTQIQNGLDNPKAIGLLNDFYNNNQVSWGRESYSQLSPEDQRWFMYAHQPGEAEARAVSRRKDLTMEERRKNFPFKQTSIAGLPTEDEGYGYDIDVNMAKELWRLNNR